MTAVLDSSAVLAMLWDEPGRARVAEVLPWARISAVNIAELVAKLVDRGATDAGAVAVLDTLGMEVIDFDQAQAVAAGLMRRDTRSAGLSLGDRACLALAKREGAPALTTDRAWTRVATGAIVETIR